MEVALAHKRLRSGYALSTANSSLDCVHQQHLTSAPMQPKVPAATKELESVLLLCMFSFYMVSGRQSGNKIGDKESQLKLGSGHNSRMHHMQLSRIAVLCYNTVN